MSWSALALRPSTRRVAEIQAYAEVVACDRARMTEEQRKRADEILTQAIAALRRDRPADDAAASRRLTAHWKSFERVSGERASFIAAIVERATQEYIQGQRGRLVERDDPEVLMLMELGL